MIDPNDRVRDMNSWDWEPASEPDWDNERSLAETMISMLKSELDQTLDTGGYSHARVRMLELLDAMPKPVLVKSKTPEQTEQEDYLSRMGIE